MYPATRWGCDMDFSKHKNFFVLVFTNIIKGKIHTKRRSFKPTILIIVDSEISIYEHRQLPLHIGKRSINIWNDVWFINTEPCAP